MGEFGEVQLRLCPGSHNFLLKHPQIILLCGVWIICFLCTHNSPPKALGKAEKILSNTLCMG